MKNDKVLVGKLGRFNVYQDAMSGMFYRRVNSKMIRLPQATQDAIIGHRTGHYSERTGALRFKPLRGFRG